jgi:hypothetical protein
MFFRAWAEADPRGILRGHVRDAEILKRLRRRRIRRPSAFWLPAGGAAGAYPVWRFMTTMLTTINPRCAL